MIPASFLYRSVTGLIAPALPLLLQRRVKAGKEDPARLQERAGYASRPRPKGPLIWMHGASVGESQVLLLLHDALRKERPDLSTLITTQTLTSAELIARKPIEGLIHQMAPLDTPFASSRFLKHWRPDLAVFAEGDIWPNLIADLDKARIPRMLVNARMTQKSFEGWMRAPNLAKKLFTGFDPILAANLKTSDVLKQITRKRIKMTGNIKFAAPPLPADDAELARLKTIIAGRPVLAAISTHPGEEALMARVMARASEKLERKPLLIIAPRHPERGPYIRSELSNTDAYLRSEGGMPTPDQSVWICDTLGELGLWIRLANLVYLGGGVPGTGIFGHNPIEPLKLERYVISQPDVSNFKQEFADMCKANAAELVETEDALLDAALPWLEDRQHYQPDLGKLQSYLAGDAPLIAARDAVLRVMSKTAPTEKASA